MSNTLIDAVALNEQFSVQRTGAADLAAVLAIYNQSIRGKQATANLVELSLDERAVWFNEHINNPKRPLYVVKTRLSRQNTNEQNSDTDTIVAWGSFSDLYPRTAYHISSEISIYLHSAYHGKGLGSLLTRWMIIQAPSLGISNIVALIFAHNQPSLSLFNKLGFTQWGYLPQVCDMDGFLADVVMLGIAVHSNKIADSAT